MSLKNLLSIGMNRKLDKNIGIFNIPAGGSQCPGKTQLCDTLCYARKAERLYKAARESRRVNLEVSVTPHFSGLVIKEIQDNKLSKVRIHESGDFYSQEYLDKWIRIMKACPGTMFLAFTKSFNLDFSSAPGNLKLYWSTDPTTKMPVPPGVTANLLPKGAPEPANVFICGPRKDHHYCGASCMHCWGGNGNVVWKQH